MKLVFFLCALILNFTIAYSQAGQKWSLSGNNSTAGDFIGTTNNAPLVLKTNNTDRMIIGGNGEFRLYGFGTGTNGFLSMDVTGSLFKTSFTGNPNDVLAGDGQFRDINSLGISTGWKLNGQIVYTENGWNVGLGTATPGSLLDVNGDAIIRGTLHVYDGIIIGKTYTGEKAMLDTVEAEKMQTEEMKAESYKTNTIVIDGNLSQITSLTGQISFGNNSLHAGGLQVNDLYVSGTLTQANLVVQQHLQIGNSSIHLSSADIGTGSDNRLYSTDGDLLIQSETGSNLNTIINANNNGYVGIGTDAPQQNLHVKGKTNLSAGPGNGTASLSAVIRLEDEAFGSMTIPSGDRTSCWDIAASASRRGLYFRTDQGVGGNSFLEVMRLDENGQMIIGPTASCAMPTNIKLVVDGHVLLTDGPTGEPRSLYWGYNCQPEWGIEYNKVDGGLNFWNPYTSTGGLANYRLFLEDETGFVGIGTNDPEYELDVCGTMRAKEIIVETGWCDYKFEPDYKLMSWEDKKAFIANNKHLPDLDPASVVENDGLAVAKNMRGMVSNIEDNTLDIIQLYETIEELKAQVQILQKQLLEMQNQQ